MKVPNVLYISDIDFNIKSGASSLGKMHFNMLEDSFKEHFYYVKIAGKTESIEKNGFILAQNNAVQKSIAITFGYPPYFNIKALSIINRLVDNYNINIIFIDNSISGRIVKHLKDRFKNKIKTICFYHDIEQNLMGAQIKEARFARKLSLLTMINNERLTSKYSDYVITLNKRDDNELNRIYGRNSDLLLPIVTKFNDEGLKNNKLHKNCQKIKLLFVGANYWPNIDGIRWFLQKVAPLLTCDFEVNIVGYKLEQYKDEFETNNSNVHVLGTVDSLKEFYLDADVIISPIYEGGGMKVKTAEALSYGKYIIALKEAMVGYWEPCPEYLKNRKVFLCKNEHEFAKAIEKLYRTEYKICDQEIYDWANSNYSYEANKNNLYSFLIDSMK